jgi:iron(III) transport system permease protein
MSITSTEANNRRLPIRLSTRGVVTGVAALFLVIISALPIVWMLVISLTNIEGSFSLENYRRLLGESRRVGLLGSSALLSATAAALATMIGAPMGLMFARADFPAKRFFRIALTVPLIVPPYVMGLAWIYAGGSSGIVARVTGRDLLSPLTYSLAGAIIVLSVCFYPLSMLATEAAARRVDASLEEAALLVASPRQVLWRITLPLIAPSVAAAALIIFALALSEFGVPGLLRARVFTTEIFTAFSALYDFGAATALAVPMLGLALAAGILARLLIGERLLVGRRGARLAQARSSHRAVIIVSLAAFTLVALPLVALAFEVGQAGRIFHAARSSAGAIINSLLISSISATLCALIGTVIGYARARMRARGLIDLALIVAFAAPSTVTGVGLIGLWNRPGLMEEVYRSSAIIVIACVARFAPLAAIILAASARQMPASFEEAAEVAGGGWVRIFARIVIPQMRAGIVAAWVVSFIFAFGELGATALVIPPGESTLPVRIYTLIANSPSSEVAALALMQSCVVIAMLASLSIIEKRLQ